MGNSTVIYCRISKDKKEGGGLGVKRQEEDCRRLAEANGWEVARVYVDNDISAYSGKARPEYQEMLAAMREGRIVRILAWHTDRLHRSPIELEDYISASERHGIATHTVKAGTIDLATPSGQAIARTLGAWAKYESDHKSERIKRKKLELAVDGKFSGGPIPFGYSRDEAGRIIPNKEQAAEVLKAVRTIINGGSIGSIVNDLNGRGVVTSRGGHWTSTAVRNMVMRSTNAGIAMHKGKETGKSEFPPIVSENEWRTAARIVKDPSRRTQFDARIKHMLAGLILCGQCEAPMKISSRSQGASATNRNYYKCPTKGGGHAFQTASPLEEFISDVVVSYLQQPSSLALFGAPAEREELERMTELQQQAVTLRERLDGYYDEAAKTGSPSPAALAKIESGIFAELEKIESRMSHARGTGILVGVAPDEIPQWWHQATVEKRRMVIEDRMVIHIDPVRKAAPRVFDTSRVRIDWKTYAV